MDSTDVKLKGSSELSESNTSHESVGHKGTMIIGTSHRLAGVFTREEDECELPEGYEPRNDDYDWRGVD
jgi:hypothetical protein